ncbi:MAG: hypothetical protein WCG27_07050 [Pseudomonadota bacterium]
MNKHLLILIFILSSCQTPPHSKTVKQNERVPDSWELIEKISSRPWSKDEIKSLLGAPADIFDRKGNKDEFWAFDDPKTSFQRFAINFSKENLVSWVVYIPQEYERNKFSIDAILDQWKTYHCIEKAEQKITPHIINTIHYFICDGGRKFFFNKWNEVSSIDIPVPKAIK